MPELFITVWLIFGATGNLVGAINATKPQSASECMRDANEPSNTQYITGVAVMNHLPFKTVEGTCAVYEQPGRDV